MTLVFFTFFAIAFIAVFALRKRLPGAEFILPLLIIAALLFAEIAARAGWMHIPKSRDRPPDQQWQIDRYTNLLGNQDEKDAFEFRGRSHQRSKEGYRIICLGTSSTFGAGLQVSQNPYPNVLENETLRIYPNWKGDVVNAGLTGYHSFQLMILLRDVLLKMSPNLVVFYYGANEGQAIQAKLYYHRALELMGRNPNLSPHQRRLMLKYGVSGKTSLRLADLLSKSHLLEAVKVPLASLAQKKYISKLRISPSEIPPDSRSILEAMTDLARNHDFQVILIPEQSAGGEPVNPRYAKLMEEMADGTWIIFQDAGGYLPQPRAGLFLDQIHMNARGHELFGKSLARLLAKFVCDNCGERLGGSDDK